MMTKTEVDPADPKEAVRLARTYPQLVTAALPKHEGRAFANLMAAYCMLFPNNKEVPTILFKAGHRAPAMTMLVSSWLAGVLMRDEVMWRKIRKNAGDVAPTSQESADFTAIATETHDA